MFNPETIYHKRAVGTDNEKIFRDILTPKNWDFQRFKKVLFIASLLETYPYFTPESIHFGALRKIIDSIKKPTIEDGNERHRGCFINIKKEELLAGKISLGNNESCIPNWDKPRDDGLYKRAIDIHSHPNSWHGVHFSGQDYLGFLSDKELISQIVSCGNVELMALKSASTPDNQDGKTLERKIDGLEKEFLGRNLSMDDLIKFQKMLCIENGLSLYIASEANRDLAEKVNLFS